MASAQDLVELLVQQGVTRGDAEAFVGKPTDLLSGASAGDVVHRDPERALSATRHYLDFWLDQRAPNAPRRGEYGW